MRKSGEFWFVSCPFDSAPWAQVPKGQAQGRIAGCVLSGFKIFFTMFRMIEFVAFLLEASMSIVEYHAGIKFRSD